MKLSIARPAQAEVTKQAAYYAEDNPTKARDFVIAIDQAFQAIAANPERWPFWPGIDANRGLRRHVVPKPFATYVIAYRTTPTHVRVLAVAHTRRQPGYWIRRP